MRHLIKTAKISAALCAALCMVIVSSAVAATVNVSDLAWIQIANGWGPVEKDKSVNGNAGGDGHTLTLNTVTYAKGFGAHANSEIQVLLNKGYASFTSLIGVDDEVGANGSVVFFVTLDGHEMFHSPVLTGASATFTIPTIDVTGGNDLRLIVDMNGNNNSDHADWCNPVLTTVTATPPNIAISASPASGTAPLSVSFTATNSGGAVTSWAWNFGDGSTASTQNTSHTYTTAGTFTATCTATGPGGSSTKSTVISTVPVSTGIHNQIKTLDANNTPTWQDSYIIRDIDGNEYHTINFGTQKWTVENLRTTRYRDGTAIPQVAAGWGTTTPAFCYYNNDPANKAIYGALYNWYAVNTGKLAPAGWHVPTDADWTTLENYLIASGHNWDVTTTGNKIAKSMAAKRLWQPSANAGAIGNDLLRNNVSAFSAFGDGFRAADGAFYYQGVSCTWWTSTDNSAALAWNRYLFYAYGSLYRNIDNKSCGFSVRLVRD